MPPAGGWRPSINLYTVLTSMQRLLAEPNPKEEWIKIYEKYRLTYLQLSIYSNNFLIKIDTYLTIQFKQHDNISNILKTSFTKNVWNISVFLQIFNNLIIVLSKNKSNKGDTYLLLNIIFLFVQLYIFKINSRGRVWD